LGDEAESMNIQEQKAFSKTGVHSNHKSVVLKIQDFAKNPIINNLALSLFYDRRVSQFYVEFSKDFGDI
jgi:hypothetical protein